MSSFFLKSPKDYIKSELDARKDLSAVSKMRPWVSVTSNLDPQFTLGTSTYFQLFGSKGLLNNGGDVRFVGNPIVEEFSVDFSERGTLRKATIKITCFTIEQFENMQKYFMEPGLSIFVQWGWNFTAESRKAISPLPIGVETQSKYYRNFKELEKIRDSNNGCYDNMLGIINRAQSEIVGNEFTITTKIVSLGELISGRPPSGVVTDRTALDPDKGDLVGTPTLISEDDLKKKQKSEKLHWYYFYNSLPEQFRSVSFSDLENIPKGINAGTDFLNYDDRLLENAKTETSITFTEDDEDDEDDKNKLWIADKGFVPVDETSPFKGKKYIKFSAFIILLNKINDILFNTEQETGDVQFSIDIGTFESPKTLCSSFKNIFSAGDAIFIPNQNSYNFLNQNPYYYNQNEFGTIHSFWNNSVVGYNNEIISFPFGTRRELPDGTSFEAFHSGWIGDVYLDHDIAMQALNNTSKPLKDTLDGVLKEMSRAVDGFWDFQIIDDPEKNSIRIVEINLRNSNKLNPLKLDFLGKESIFLESNFNFDIPKEISNMIVLTKTDKSAITQESKLSGLYSDSQDVVLSKLIKKKAENKAKTAPQPNLSLLDDKRLWKGITQDCRLLLQPFASRLHEEFPASQEEQKNIILIGCSNNKEAFNRIIKNAIAKNSTGYAPIHAIKASFTILGISGFKFGDVLDIRGIPKKYTNGTNGLFMITEVTHKLDNELWTTNVTLMFRPNFGR